MPKILIVEDDKNISELITDFLSLAGYETEHAFDGSYAVSLILNRQYDLILLDIMLPGIDGYEVIRQVRSAGTPVLFLSAKSDADSVVKGLRLGAEDYIRKPFDRLELLARIEMVLKRTGKEQNVYTFKDICLDIKKKVVTKSGEPISLRPKEFALLELLMKNLNVALSRDQILDLVWGVTTNIETRTVDYHIQQLRKKLDLKQEIVTVIKVGYRLEQ